MSYKVDGILKRIEINGIYKYYVEDGIRYFKEFEDAFKYSNKIYNYTKIMIGVRKNRKKSKSILDKKKSNMYNVDES